MLSRRFAAAAARLALVLFAFLLTASPASHGQEQGQERWSWPERAENLRELPEDFPPERLSAVMRGFTRALGVRCSHCHLGEEGAPLSSYDFASDEVPTKETAREMLRMLGSINEHLEKIEPSGERVNMWCHTCHRGQPRPVTLEEVLTQTYARMGLEVTVERFRDLRARHYGSGTYDFSEPAVNRMAYGLLGAGETEAAIAFFRLNAEHYPDSANTWDSLAEAYLEDGQRELARVFYEKSLQVDPENSNAVEKLRELRAAEAAPEAAPAEDEPDP